jgi:hypothetical protein
VDSLRTSFARQIEVIELVRDLELDGDEVTFSRPDGSGEEVSWRVHISSAVVEAQDDEALPYRGIVTASWYANDRALLSGGGTSELPLWILDAGLSQECWAFWEESSSRWGW